MKITAIPNGPLMIETAGPWTWTGAERPAKSNDRVAFCRCGGSANKPFCDGTHRTNGFEAPGGACELTPK